MLDFLTRTILCFPHETQSIENSLALTYHALTTRLDLSVPHKNASTYIRKFQVVIIGGNVSYVMTQPSVNITSALQRMRDGILFLFIAWIFLGVGILAMVFTALASLATWSPINGGWVGILAGLGIGLAILVIGVILALIGLYGKFIPGLSELARANPEFSTASSLIKIGYVWGLVLLLVGAILTLLVIGIFIAFIGLILLVIGYVGMIILCFKLNDAYQNTLYLVAGILFILSIFIPILGVVAWILIYVALGDTIRKTQTPPTPAQGLIQV